MKTTIRTLLTLVSACCILHSSIPIQAQGTAFTYQGRLNDGGSPANGTYDLRFVVCDTSTNGNEVSGVLTNAATAVSNGLFTVTLDFGADVFTGENRWLEIAVRTNGAVSFSSLVPRQWIAAAPYAVSAGNLTGTLPAGQISGVVPLAQLPAAVITNYATTASLAGFFNGSFGGSFYGDGSGLTGLNPANLSAGTAVISISGNATTATSAVNATNLIGNVVDAQIPANLVRLNGTNNFTGTNTFSNVVIATNVNNRIAGVFTGNGAALTNLNTAQFANSVLTNNETGLTLAGAFSGNLNGNGVGVTNVNAARLNGLGAANFWQLGGNNVAAGQFLGSTDYQPLEFKVGNIRGLRIEPTPIDLNHSGIVNIVGGSPYNSIASGVYGSVIAGGGGDYYGDSSNLVYSDMSFLGGGVGNSTQPGATYAFLGSGYGNRIGTNAYGSFLGSGDLNSIQEDADDSVLGGGHYNSIQMHASLSFLGGGLDNLIQMNATCSVLGGGYNNINAAAYSVVPGGRLNYAGGMYSTVSGGTSNSVVGYASFLGGGCKNSVAGDNAVVGGGYGNAASGPGAFVGGGGYDGNNIITNLASGPASVVVGGTQNTASGNYSTVGGGSDNIATNYYATVPGGAWNVAGGQGSFAAGQAAKALHDGAFVWSDNWFPDVVSTNANSVTMRASGGYRLFSNSGMTAGVYLAPGGGSWITLSDRNAKENFTPVDATVVLEKVAELPLSTWNYKSQDASIRHIGPMAQDFKAAFKVGETDTGIATVDEGGVALAAIQGLNEKVEVRIQKLEVENADLKARLEKLEQLIKARNGGEQ